MRLSRDQGSDRKHAPAEPGRRAARDRASAGHGSWDPIVGASASAKIGGIQLTGVRSTNSRPPARSIRGSATGSRRGVALSHRFGPAPHEHGESTTPSSRRRDRRASRACAFELGRFRRSRRRMGRARESPRRDRAGERRQMGLGRARACASIRRPAGRLRCGVALPLWQRIRASHPDNDYRLTLSLGRAF